jgi:hypothetical protein
MRATCPSHLILLRLDDSIYIWWRVHLIKVLIMQFSPTYYFVLLCPNILLSILFSNTFSLCSSLNVRDQVSCPYKKTRSEIIVLYILILTILNPAYYNLIGI